MGEITKIKVDGEPESSYQLYPRNEEFAKRSEGVQPDWNQNDDTQPDYVKNRPFYSETRNVTVEDATDAVLEGFPIFAVGDTVTVNVDGVEHSLVAYDDEGLTTIGDTYSSVENGEGLLGWQICADYDSVWFYATEAHTVSYLMVVGRHKIDPKYLPDSVLSAVDTDAYQVRILGKDDGEFTLVRGAYDVIREKLANCNPINVEIVLIRGDHQYFFPVGIIYYDGDDMCIKIHAVSIDGTTSLQIVVFYVNAGNTINVVYYQLQ